MDPKLVSGRVSKNNRVSMEQINDPIIFRMPTTATKHVSTYKNKTASLLWRTDFKKSAQICQPLLHPQPQLKTVIIKAQEGVNSVEEFGLVGSAGSP